MSEVGGSEGEGAGGVGTACPEPGLLPCNSRAGHRPELLRELQRLHVTHTVRKLHVGDFVWVAQETRPSDPGKGRGQVGGCQRQDLLGRGTRANRSLLGLLAARPKELVLDHIVERKRLDDLCSSIIDGRFREQKVPYCLTTLPAPCLLWGPPSQPRGVRGTSGWP